MNTDTIDFDEMVKILHNKEWAFKRNVNDVVRTGSQFVVTALLDEGNTYTIGLYGKTIPDSADPMQWYTFHIESLDSVFEFFDSIDFVKDHSEMFNDLWSNAVSKNTPSDK